jgi:cell division protein FtsZ
MSTVPETTSTTARGLAIKVIGVGGAGAKMIDHLASRDVGGATLAVVHTNARVLETVNCAEKIQLGAKLLRGLGAGGDPDMGKAAAEEGVDRLKSLCTGADLILIVGGLGGGTATGTAPVLARVARETGALVLGVMTLPFEFEGQRRQRQAQAALPKVRGAADGVLCLRNQKICGMLDENIRATEIFGHANELWGQGIQGILGMLTRRGLIDVDFADLSAVLRGRQTESCFASVEASGEARSRELVERVLTHPLLDGGRALAGANALLVTLTGGPDMTMADVTYVMDQIRRQPENAQFVMGAAVREEFAGKLHVTVVAAVHGQGDGEKSGSEESGGDSPDPHHSGGPIETKFFDGVTQSGRSRSGSHYAAPAPQLSDVEKNRMFTDQNGKAGSLKQAAARLRQGQLPLEIISKGRFEKSQPTLHRGEDLDVPTYIRRGIKLN